MDEHEGTPNKNELKCEYCYTICKSKKILHDHQKNAIKCIKAQGNTIEILKCNNCEKEYKGNDAYRRHISKCYN